jgi:hypothetical protein
MTDTHDIISLVIETAAMFYLITMSLTTQTRDVISSILFKVVPFFLGLGCLYIIAVLAKLIN